MEGAVAAMLDSYPAATLQDIYKGMFQDRFGVAHMLGSREAVREYIEREVAQLDAEYRPTNYLTPCGWRGDYLRVDLAAVRDGKITLDELTDAFFESALCGIAIDEAAIERWAEEWATIESVCHESLLELEGYAADSTMLAELIASGQYVVHHSDSFNAHYAPHYRILRSDIARRLMVE